MRSSQAFNVEREAFRQFKQAVEEDGVLKSDIETALQELLGRFSTTIYENRFVVGGILEVIMVAALRAAGIDAQDVGVQQERIDIRIPGGGFSVKGHFRSSGTIRLINVLGKSSQAQWSEATLFVLHGIGIGYTDPDLITHLSAVQRVGDAVAIRYTALRSFFRANPEWLIPCSVPESTLDEASSELVSRALARQILDRTRKLAKALPDGLF
ncbi:MAG: hypothetical protein NZM10_03455 [Fimbriimonadales bacterium]|nr:hypothetical protein [Fimbriimonadales bacterium]MCS7191164.1 hypothetical protein [Fimbriimonadales bacterium]